MAWIGEWWNQVSGTIQHGLEITVVGMALVFFTLGLVIVATILLTRLPWLRAKVQPEEAPSADAEAPAATVQTGPAAPRDAPTEDELARVAAIAVAMLRSSHRARTRVQTTTTRSAWKSYGRANQLGL